MSFPNAVEFIRRVRDDQLLKRRLSALSVDQWMEGLMALGREIGLEFQAQEFDAAFKHDWRMRWLKHSARHPYQSTEEDSAMR